MLGLKQNIYAFYSRESKRKFFKRQLDMILWCLAVGRPTENLRSMFKLLSKRTHTRVKEIKEFFLIDIR